MSRSIMVMQPAASGRERNLACSPKCDIEAVHREIGMSEPLLLSERASDAIGRFAKLAERAQLETRGEKRVDVAARYAAARRALAPRECAILDMMALKRRTLGDLAVQTGQSVESLGQLLLAAGERLADHFESRGVGDSGGA